MANQHFIQEQRLTQLQKLSPQQYLLAKLVELPLPDLEQRVRDELYDNVALEEGRTNENDNENENGGENDNENENENGGEDFGDGGDLTAAAEISEFAGDDELPVYTSQGGNRIEAEIPIGDTRSFIEDLEAQISEYDVTPHQRELITYLIGSLDDRGFVERPLRNIADDLLFNHGIETDEQQLAAALAVLQQFDPPGIGARNLQECLLIQLDRLMAEQAATPSQTLARSIVADHFLLFQRNEPKRMAEALHVSIEQIRDAITVISRLNPHPGRSLHEAADDRAQTIIPDFIVDTDHESNVSFSLNNGEVPSLHVSPDYAAQLRQYQSAEGKMSRSEREAFAYTRQKVESARMFIDAIRQRQQTLTATMSAIIHFQREFMLTQDDALLRPLRLSDVAERTHLNISTISRVINSKYALVDGTLYPLKFFFLRTRANADGQEILKTHIYPLMREIIDAEDKANPLSDEQISDLMRQHGQAISRRTVAKYRDEMNIPVAALRRRL